MEIAGVINKTNKARAYLIDAKITEKVFLNNATSKEIACIINDTSKQSAYLIIATSNKAQV